MKERQNRVPLAAGGAKKTQKAKPVTRMVCASCDGFVIVNDPEDKFIRNRKVSCPCCGQPHRVDLYFIGELDMYGLVPVASIRALQAEMDEDLVDI